jgi:hypothetical protein
VRREVRGVDGDPVAVEAVEVLADATPTPVEPGWIVVPARELAAELLQHLVGDGRVAQAVLAEHLERHALVHLRLVRRVREELEVGVRVHVDEPRADEQAVGFDRPRRRLPAQATHRGDAAACDADVRCVPGVAGTVDYVPAADQEIEHVPAAQVGNPLTRIRDAQIPEGGCFAPAVSVVGR